MCELTISARRPFGGGRAGCDFDARARLLQYAPSRSTARGSTELAVVLSSVAAQRPRRLTMGANALLWALSSALWVVSSASFARIGQQQQQQPRRKHLPRRAVAVASEGAQKKKVRRRSSHWTVARAPRSDGASAGSPRVGRRHRAWHADLSGQRRRDLLCQPARRQVRHRASDALRSGALFRENCERGARLRPLVLLRVLGGQGREAVRRAARC
jgi:hypothetical protein